MCCRMISLSKLLSVYYKKVIMNKNVTTAIRDILLIIAVISIIPVGSVLADDLKISRQKALSSKRIYSVTAETKIVTKTKEARQKLPHSFLQGVWNTNVHVRLPVLKLDKLRTEDKKNNSKEKPTRIGVVRQLQQKAGSAAAKSNQGGWIELSDGSHVWQLTIEAPDTIGIRIHIDGLSMPKQCEIAVFNTLDPTEMRGPYTVKSLHGRDEFWTGTVFAESVTLECYCPADISISEVSLSVDKIIHIYKDPFLSSQEGNCHNDVTCFSQWSSEANSVAGIGTVGGTDYLWCTGCLLNDQDPSTYIDYFITANHCVSDQSEANTTEFYWFFQTSICNGSPPFLSSVPSTDGGADYLAGRTESQANDFAFLRLRNATPNGVSYAGWTSESPTLQETLAGIHHPDGAYKRISFANLNSSSANYWYVQWYSGVTEPGSSGSPLFDSDHNFIGQLWGGASSCSQQSGIDDYGRFDVSFSYIQSWLTDNGGDDPYEENDSLATAYNFSNENMWLSSIAGYGRQGDDDWYAINISPSGNERVQINCNFSHAEGDIDIELVNASGTVLADGGRTSTDNEFIDYIVPSIGTYYIRVWYGNANNSYNLRWNDILYAPNLSHLTHTIDDDSSGDSIGNGDGDVNPGETIEMVITLQNTGNVDAHNVIADLSTSNIFVSINNSSENFGNISAGGSAPSLGDYEFTVSSNCPDGQVITFNLSITADEGTWNSIFTETVPLPTVEITSPTTENRFTTPTNMLNIAGTAYDNVGVSYVVVRNDREGFDRTCSGTSEWVYNQLPLFPGRNEITVTAFDSSGYSGNDRLTVFYIDKKPANDFDGDGLSDIGTFHPDSGNWQIMGSIDGEITAQFGYYGTVPITGDFDGDDKTDFGCYDAAGLYNNGEWLAQPGSWYVMKSTDGFDTETFGYRETIPFTGDFDGDGRADFGCYDPAGLYSGGQWLALPGSWYIMQSTAGFRTETFGYKGTVPIVGDFDGDGKADFGCYDAAGLFANGQWIADPGSWYIMQSTAGFRTETFGYKGTIPIVGDFDGDGIADFGCYDAAGLFANGQWIAKPGSWYIMQSDTGFRTEDFGYNGTVPFAGDYDGDATDDFGCYDQNLLRWYIMQSDDGFSVRDYGFPGALPIGPPLIK